MRFIKRVKRVSSISMLRTSDTIRTSVELGAMTDAVSATSPAGGGPTRSTKDRSAERIGYPDCVQRSSYAGYRSFHKFSYMPSPASRLHEDSRVRSSFLSRRHVQSKPLMELVAPAHESLRRASKYPWRGGAARPKTRCPRDAMRKSVGQFDPCTNVRA